MWNYWSDDIKAFTKLNKTNKNDIGGAIGTQLAISLTIFIAWILSHTIDVKLMLNLDHLKWWGFIYELDIYK